MSIQCIDCYSGLITSLDLHFKQNRPFDFQSVFSLYHRGNNKPNWCHICAYHCIPLFTGNDKMIPTLLAIGMVYSWGFRFLYNPGVESNIISPWIDICHGHIFIM